MLLAFNQYPTPYNNIHNALIVNALFVGGDFMYQ